MLKRYCKEAKSILEPMFNHLLEFTVDNTKDTAKDILTTILGTYGVIHDSTLYKYENSSWVDTGLESSYLYSTITIEGDTLVDGDSLNTTLDRPLNRIEEELPEITRTSKAFYDLIITLYEGSNKKAYVISNEMSIQLHSNGYKVTIKNILKKSVSKHQTNRIDLLDNPAENNPREIKVNPRYSTLDYGKGSPVKKPRVKEDPRFSHPEVEGRRRRRLEAQTLLFQTDTQQDQTQLQNKTANQKLGKQVATSTQQVSKSIQSQVDKMSYQKAFDTLEDIKRVWDDTDAYNQYTDTVDLSSNWYQNNLVLVSGFDVIDKSYKAADLMRKISKLNDDLYNTKSRSAQAKIQKELDKAQDELNQLLPEVQKALHGAQGYDQVEKKTKALEERQEDYLEDYNNNIAEWNALRDRMEKAGKMIETMEAMKSKYLSRHDLPPLLSRYKTLMETPIPSLLDASVFEKPDAGVIYTAWRDIMLNYKKALDAFNSAFYTTYDVLAPILGVKARNKSLF